jgi:hypothetical protein
MQGIPPSPSFFAYLVMAAYPLLGLLLDAFLPRHKAVLSTLLAGFLFLPSVEVDIGGLLYWNRSTAPILVIFLGVAFRDTALLSRLRLRWFDIPMIAWCLVPFASSVTAGFGAYDGMAQGFYHGLTWGGPYLLGRLHFRTREQLVDLAKILFIGGLIYLPLCVFEVRMSPMLHRWLYGFNQHSFAQTIRGRFFRPVVFLQHGLMVAMWMAMTAYIGWVLTAMGRGVRFLGLPAIFWPVLMALALLSFQSFGAAILLLAIWGCTVLSRAWQGATLLLMLASVPFVWAVFRTTGVLSTESISTAVSFVDARRSDSLAFRLDAEDKLVEHALNRPIFGWSPTAANQAEVAYGPQKAVVSDGLWIITFAAFGMIGLISMLLVYLVPFLISLRHAPPRVWASEPNALLAGGLGLVIAITSIDNLMNAMINPLFILIMGALPTVLSGSDQGRTDSNGSGPELADCQDGKPRFGRQFGSPPLE